MESPMENTTNLTRLFNVSYLIWIDYRLRRLEIGTYRAEKDIGRKKRLGVCNLFFYAVFHFYFAFCSIHNQKERHTTYLIHVAMKYYVLGMSIWKNDGIYWAGRSH